MLIKIGILFCAIVLICRVSFADASVSAENRLEWWNDIPGFLNQQHKHSLDTVDSILRRFPPAKDQCEERRAALLLLDNVMHDVDAPERPAVQAFFVQRTEAAAASLKEQRTTKGARIWKLYNDGFIVRTTSATIAFDIVTGKHVGKGAFVLPDSVIEDFARECDAMFISHMHPDHADPRVAEAFVRSGRPVAVPEGLWRDQPFADKLIRLNRDANAEQSVPIRDGAAKLAVVNCAGHQGEFLPNNVAIVTTPDGISVAHVGDQSNDKDFQWIDKIGEKRKIDILMPNCWAPQLPRMIQGFRPAVVIPGHENELDHTIDHREPYWLDQVRLGKESSRAILMAIGESYEYTRD